MYISEQERIHDLRMRNKDDIAFREQIRSELLGIVGDCSVWYEVWNEQPGGYCGWHYMLPDQPPVHLGIFRETVMKNIERIHNET